MATRSDRVFTCAWLYGLSGILLGWAGDIARDCLLWNPRNPTIDLAFMLLIVTAATLVAATWRRAYIEPIPESERTKLAGTTGSG